MRKSSPLDNLRSGILLDGRYKLTERIPRWVANRRFIAKGRSERLQVLFFLPEKAPAAVTPDWLAFLEHTDDPFWLKPILQGQGAGFVYLGLPLVRGPSLRQMLDEGRPWFCEDAARFLYRLVESLRPLAEAEMDVPCVSLETLLVGKEGREFIPALFPFGLPGLPPESYRNLPAVLRALLYELVARRPAPAVFDEEALAALPPPARNKWARVFTDPPSWDRLADLSTATRVPLPPLTPRPPAEASAEYQNKEETEPPSTKIPPPHPLRSSPASRVATRNPSPEIHVPMQRSRSRRSRSGKGRFPIWSPFGILSGLAGTVAVVAVAWFSWHLVASFLHADNGWTNEAIPSSMEMLLPDPPSSPPSPVQPMAATSAEFAPGALTTEYESVADPTSLDHDWMPSSLEASQNGTAPLSLSLHAPPPRLAPEPTVSNGPAPLPLPEDASFPKEDAGKIGSALVSWQAQWEQEKDNAQVIQAYERYLQGLSPQIDSMRSGRLPKVLQDLEKIAEGGFPAARYLLAQVLWGRDSRRSEALMIALAREEYAPARVWCLERNIIWD